MKAAFFRKHGGPEVMEYGDYPDPVAGPGQVLVDVHAASVNGADWKVRAGSYAPITNLPYIPGRDFSGVVCALGAGVTDFKVGDEVFGVCDVGPDRVETQKEWRSGNSWLGTKDTSTNIVGLLSVDSV
jgi:NADPH:quinone reductase-like Zn-dependent oxidoreductase